MKARISIRNDFHRSQIWLRANLLSPGPVVQISVAQGKKAKKALCGIDGCQCGDDIGQRSTGGGFALYPLDGGGWRLEKI